MKPRQPTDASRQGAKSGQVLLRDKGTPGDPSTEKGLPVIDRSVAAAATWSRTMTIDTAPATNDRAAAHDAGRPVMAAPRVVGMLSQLRPREPLGLSYVCPACFGPLEVAYDKDVVRRP